MLSVDDSTPAPIRFISDKTLGVLPENYWRAYETLSFVFDGKYWCALGKGLASTEYYGVTKLEDSIVSSATDLAATPNAVKTVYDMHCYGTCETGADDGAKKITTEHEDVTVVQGTHLTVLFNKANSASSVTLQVDDGPSYPARTAGGIGNLSGCWTSEQAVEFVFDGSSWIVVSSAGSSGSGVAYATCATVAEQQRKVATTANKNFQRQIGSVVNILFSYGNGATEPTLDVDGTGSAPIVYAGTSAIPSIHYWQSEEVVSFVYDGTSWCVLGTGLASANEYGITKLDSSVDSDSTTTAATPSAVKAAYDLASGMLPLSGGTMTGALTLAGDPSEGADAATKQYVDDQVGSIALYYRCTCESEVDSAAKAVTIEDDRFALEDGTHLFVTFANGNTANDVTLQVNDGTACTVQVGTDAAIPATYWQAGQIVELMFKGTAWVIVGTGLASTGHYGVTKLSSAIDSEAEDVAATPKAVKAAYDYATELLADMDLSENTDFVSLNESLTQTRKDLATLQDDFSNDQNKIVAIARSDDGSELTVTYADERTVTIPLETGVDLDSVYYDEEYYLHFYNKDGEDLFDPVFIQGGGGGGGSTTTVTVKIDRLNGSSLQSLVGESMPIQFNFSSIDSSGDDTGDAQAVWYVDNVSKATSTVYQGVNEFDVGSYLTTESKVVKVVVTDSTGMTATKTWTVKAVSLYFTWEYDDSQINQERVTLRWTPYGDLSKTTHIVIDGDTENEITSTTTRSGSVQTYSLSALSHGAHDVELYVTATVGNSEVQTSSVHHSVVFVEDGNTDVIIGSSYMGGTIQQYNTVSIPIMLYNPSSVSANAILYVNGEQFATWTGMDRTIHYWNYTPSEAGHITLKVESGTASISWALDVTELDIDNDEVDGYLFRLKASDLAGNDSLQTWDSNDVTCTFSDNFDWENGGVQSELDSDNNIRQFICVKAGTWMQIQHQLFASDCKRDGKNLKIMFRLQNCRNYDAEWFTCYDGKVGIRMLAQEAIMKSEQTTVSVPYYEGTTDPIELEFDVRSTSAYSYIMPWVDGVQAGVAVYPSNDQFVQSPAQYIKIGSEDCDVYVYMLKAYDRYLENEEHLENFIADAPNAQEMLERYQRNDILDANQRISYLKTAQQNPDLRVHVYDLTKMFLGDKKADAITGNEFRLYLGSESQDTPIYTASNVAMKIQGTSSVGYYDSCANWDSEFKEGITDTNGESTLYKMDDDAIPVSYINYKVNTASCEGSNNAVNVEWYNQYQPYIRPYRANTVGVRDTMQLQPGVVFFRDKTGDLWSGDSENYNIYAVVACGNSKKNYTVFHDPNNAKECCMEIANNTSAPCLMTVECSDDDVRNTDYFEFRYPKKPTDEMYEAWKRFVNWMYASNPNAATGEALEEAVTFGSYTVKGVEATTGETQADDVLQGTTISIYAGTYTTDSYEYRMAKMLSECEDYLILDSVSYHYLFIETKTAIDNVAKNTFWGSHDLQHWYLVHHYDCDTACGNDNEGGLTLTYGYEAMDTIGTKTVFNASQAVWFQFMNGLYDLNRVMYINREGKGTWDHEAYLKAHTEFQSTVPERIRIQDYWYKYLRRYEQNNDSAYLDMLEGGLKTYQRWQFEVYQHAYMASRYAASYATNDRVTLRTYTPTTSGLVVAPKNEITLTMYAKMYINVLVGSISKQVKAERGQSYTIAFPEAGSLNDTETYLYSAQWITGIEGLPQLYPGVQYYANATRLKLLEASSSEDGYVNYNATSITLGANTMLETLIVPNLPNATTPLDLSNCQSLQYLDARGSGFTGFTFAKGGKLETAYLPSPGSITAQSLTLLQVFTLESCENLLSLIVENCSGINAFALVEDAAQLGRVRLIGIDWSDSDGDVATVLDRLYEMRGYDETGMDLAQSVLAGCVYIDTIRELSIAKYESAWGDDLVITYNAEHIIKQVLIQFLNGDESVLYETYVDVNGFCDDPVAVGLIDAPTLAPTDSTQYTFSTWDRALSGFTMDTTIRPVFTSELRSYTITWVPHSAASMTERHSKTVTYGSAADYEWDIPQRATQAGSTRYYLFTGWDRSTAYVTGDMTVYGVWDEANLDSWWDGSTRLVDKKLNELTPAQFYGLVQQGKICTLGYAATGDTLPITMGCDFDFSATNLQHTVLVGDGGLYGESLSFSGDSYVATDIAPFTNEDNWTFAIDYRCTGTGYLMDAYPLSGGRGLRLSVNGNYVRLSYGSQSMNIGYLNRRDMLVLRYVSAEETLYVYASNGTVSAYSLSITAQTLSGMSDTFSETLPITFGARYLGYYTDYAQGDVYWCKLWHGDLGDVNCRALAEWPHETYTLEMVSKQDTSNTGGRNIQYYDGMDIANLGNSVIQYTTIDFIFQELLAANLAMGTSSSEDYQGDGYAGSQLREFLNTRFYRAIPLAWRQIIMPIVARSVVDGKSSTVTTVEYLYAPARADLLDCSSLDYYADEAPTGVISSAVQTWLKRSQLGSTTAVGYWTRSGKYDSSKTFYAISSSGRLTTMTATTEDGICVLVSF
jgi:hypothetical protein